MARVAGGTSASTEERSGEVEEAHRDDVDAHEEGAVQAVPLPSGAGTGNQRTQYSGNPRRSWHPRCHGRSVHRPRAYTWPRGTLEFRRLYRPGSRHRGSVGLPHWGQRRITCKGASAGTGYSARHPGHHSFQRISQPPARRAYSETGGFARAPMQRGGVAAGIRYRQSASQSMAGTRQSPQSPARGATS